MTLSPLAQLELSERHLKRSAGRRGRLPATARRAEPRAECGEQTQDDGSCGLLEKDSYSASFSRPAQVGRGTRLAPPSGSQEGAQWECLTRRARSDCARSTTTRFRRAKSLTHAGRRRRARRQAGLQRHGQFVDEKNQIWNALEDRSGLGEGRRRGHQGEGRGTAGAPTDRIRRRGRARRRQLTRCSRATRSAQSRSSFWATPTTTWTSSTQPRPAERSGLDQARRRC